jgi:3-carboxy-cis,cis-muconate cycloisomerase
VRRCSLPSSEFDVGLLSPVTVGHDGLVSDAEIASAMVEVEVALARASAAVGLVPESAAEAIATALTGFRPDPAALARDARDGGNPVIPLVAALRSRVAEADPDGAGWVHRGATSQDIIDSALMLVASRAVQQIEASLGDAADSLARLATEHRDTIMAARTLTQQSTPTTFGLVAASWLLAVDEARVGLTQRLPAQLGGASGTLASFVELGDAKSAAALPARFAAELGLEAPAAPWHTRRGAVTRLGDILATVTDALGAIATNVATLSRTEIGELSEAGGAGHGGSSAMPQKQNPVLSVLIRSAAQRAPGLAAELHRSAALTVDQRPDGAWHAEWPVLRELLRVALGASATAAELLGGLRIDRERMRANLAASGPLLVAERLALVLGPRLGSSPVQQLIDRATAGEDLAALLADESGIGDLDLGELLDPANYTGAAGILVDAAVADHAARSARPVSTP